jgi:CheY-specific phosphatase CheX
MAVAGAIVAGGAAIMLLVASGVANAASPTTSAQPAASAAASQTTANNPFGRTETVSDQSVVAGVIGITEAQLDTALSSGQTVAAVAKAHNVDPQKVIDALVTDGLNELAAQVKAGTLTQAQADAQKAEVTQRATDQVNGTMSGRQGDPGGASRTETVSDQSVVAGVIGITEAQLDTALSSGQTVAAVAKAHNVDPQKVIDALVTDGLNELAAQVKAGTLTQAQADAQKAEVTQRATDQVNGTMSGRQGDPGGASH